MSSPDLPKHWHTGIDAAPTAELLVGYARVLGELRRRGVVRSANAPAGDYAEWVCWQALGGALEPNSKKAYDLLDDQGRTVQVKARVVSNPPKPGQIQTSPFRSWNFSHVAFVLLDERDYDVQRASLLPAEVFEGGAKLATRVDYVNGWYVYMTPSVLDHPAALDLTDALNEAARTETRPAMVATSNQQECVHLMPPQQCSICRGRSIRPARRTSGEDRHRWTRDDHLVVVGAYLEYGSVNLPATAKEELAELVGCSYASIAFKLGNIDAHLAGGALTSGSQVTREVADELVTLGAGARREVVAAARDRLREG